MTVSVEQRPDAWWWKGIHPDYGWPSRYMVTEELLSTDTNTLLWRRLAYPAWTLKKARRILRREQRNRERSDRYLIESGLSAPFRNPLIIVDRRSDPRGR